MNHKYKIFLLLSSTISLLTFSASAQESFEYHLGEDLFNEDFYGKIQFEGADLDLDGDYDIVALTSSTLWWYENYGHEDDYKPHIIQIEDNGLTLEMKTMDLDLDGDVDIVIASKYSIVWVENLGNQEFTEIIAFDFELGYDYHSNFSFHFADLDLDGDLDLIKLSTRNNVGEGERNLKLYENVGDGSFIETIISSDIHFNNFPKNPATDLDNDGDIDLVGTHNGGVYWLEKNGDEYIGPSLVSDNCILLTVNDFNGDGMSDLVCREYQDGKSTISISLNQGAGDFSKHTQELIERGVPRMLQAVDFDLDGDYDLFEENGRWLVNDGSGVFSDMNLRIGLSRSRRTSFGDMDGDGDTDIISFEGYISWYKNAGNGDFIQYKIDSGYIKSKYLIDIDNDDDLDIVTVSQINIVLYLNDGNGKYKKELGFPLKNLNEITSLDFGDLDSDGDLDIVAGSSFTGVFWLEKSESLIYHDVSKKSRLNTKYVTVADYNADGVLDIISMNYVDEKINSRYSYSYSEIALYKNIGLTEFENSVLLKYSAPYYINTIEVTDFDTDEDIDFLVKYGISGLGIELPLVWFENMDGLVLNERTFDNWPLNSSYHDLLPVDIDQDGDVDLVGKLDQRTPWIKRLMWLENNGNQSFTSHVIDELNGYSKYSFMDMNQDGYIDILSDYEWYENSGEQSFEGHIFEVGVGAKTPGDIDGDGDIDLLFHGYFQYNQGLHWFENLRPIDLSSENLESEGPSDYVLDQNHPNPFNSKTQIQYHLKKSSKVSLAIYNQLGQEVYILANKDRPAGGHQITWNGTDQAGNKLASGIYIYRLTTNEFTETRKMVLIR